MKAAVTREGLTLDRSWFNGCDEVEVLKVADGVLIRPAADALASRAEADLPDPIWDLGRAPILTDAVSDASQRHDEFIYRGR